MTPPPPDLPDLPVGPPVPGWTPRPLPSAAVLTGRSCRLERLDADRHAAQLFPADRLDVEGRSWTYLPYGPFEDLPAYRAWVEAAAAGDDPRFYAVVTDAGAVGVMAYLRTTPADGTIEVGHVHFSPLLQRRRASTEAQYLLMRYAFVDLGYRRYEWKCDALNAASRAAAERLGFTYEGTFRQDRVVKGRNRDTAWYSIIDGEWPAVRDAFETWLDPANLAGEGRQRERLRAREAATWARLAQRSEQ